MRPPQTAFPKAKIETGLDPFVGSGRSLIFVIFEMTAISSKDWLY
jgi:hypothetical protein